VRCRDSSKRAANDSDIQFFLNRQQDFSSGIATVLRAEDGSFADDPRVTLKNHNNCAQVAQRVDAGWSPTQD
jgi:hypothetical protein